MWDIAENFEIAFRTDYEGLCNIANNIIKNEKAAEDIVQDIFLKLWSQRNTLLIKTNYKSYLKKATINASIDFLEQSGRTVRIEKNVELTTEENPEKNLSAKELQQKIEKSIRNLPTRCRAIFILSRYEEMKYREIAEHLDISEKTVENQMGIALEKLRNDLKHYLEKFRGAGGRSTHLLMMYFFPV